MEKIIEFFKGNREPEYSDRLPNQLLLTCRALVGGYLYYLAYGLRDGIVNPESSTMRMVLIAAVIIFLVFGFVFMYASGRNFIIGRYVGGALDLGERPVGEETESEAIEGALDDAIAGAISGTEDEPELVTAEDADD